MPLLEWIKAIIPADTDVIFLGDGEFDGSSYWLKLKLPGDIMPVARPIIVGFVNKTPGCNSMN